MALKKISKKELAAAAKELAEKEKQSARNASWALSDNSGRCGYSLG